MKRYDEKILNSLLDKYENSLLYTGQNQRNQSISFLFRKHTLPEYFEDTSMEFQLVHAQLAELQQKGFVQLVWQQGKAGHILEKCVLQVEKAEEIYGYLHRKTRAQKEAEIASICQEYQGSHAVLDAFLSYVTERMLQRESVAQYVDRDCPGQLASRCRLILHILENREEIFLREFSVRYCNDSKLVEKEIAAATGIIARFYPEAALAELTTEQILEEFHIYRNPSWVMVKGRGSFRAGSSAVFLADLPGGVGLSSQDMGRICWDRACLPRRIVTIENLTSFHRWQEEGTLAIYLGGYHNRAKRAFLQELYRTFPDSVYEHFGDLDCGGFLIWKDLCAKTKIPFVPRYMDTESYLQFCETGKKLTEHDRKTLQRMLEDPFFAEQRELFQTMLETGKKVEQEGIQTEVL